MPAHATSTCKPSEPSDPLRELISTFNELNGSTVEELLEEPSPLEFMRYVARNTPFVARGAASGWRAVEEWDRDVLVGRMRGEGVNVAVTPKGNADAPTRTDDRRLVFVKPHEEEQDFEKFLDYVIQQEKDPGVKGEIRYAQTQNNNLPSEYTALAHQVPSSIPFARIALDRPPDAANLWIGNSRSVTALHKDNYENIYVQIRGKKHFVLLPPLCFPVVREEVLPSARYVRGEDGELRLEMEGGGTDGGNSGSGSDGEGRGEEDGGEEEDASEEREGSPMKGVPFPTWDPDGKGPGVEVDDQSMLMETGYEGVVRPLRVTLQPGDMLYLPAMWYHKVSQSCADEDEGFVLAVNYWYDMDFSGPFYPLCAMVRNITKASRSHRQTIE